MKYVEDTNFRFQVVTLDDTEFFNCTFDACDLILSKDSKWIMDSCEIKETNLILDHNITSNRYLTPIEWFKELKAVSFIDSNDEQQENDWI